MDAIGVVFLRPGHIEPAFAIAMLAHAFSAGVDVEPPFMVVVQDRAGTTTIRVRELS
jgi:hypothetical protein